MKNMGIKYSLILHLVILILLYFGFPSINPELNKDMVVSVEIAPISELSNLQNYSVHEKNKSKPNKSEEVKPQAKPIDDSKSDKKPEEAERNIEKNTPKEEISLKPKKAETKKTPQETKKSSKKLPKKPVEQKTKNELDSLLKNLDEESIKSDEKIKKATKQSETSDNKSMSNKQFDETLPLSMSEKDAIKAQIERKFSNPVAMQFAPGTLVVHIKFTLDADGAVRNAIPLSSSTYPAQYSNAYHSISEGLIRAAYSASPLQGISRGDEIILTFDAYYLMNN
jgi:outer membrane biosynthesis protein TonB